MAVSVTNKDIKTDEVSQLLGRIAPIEMARKNITDFVEGETFLVIGIHVGEVRTFAELVREIDKVPRQTTDPVFEGHELYFGNIQPQPLTHFGGQELGSRFCTLEGDTPNA